MTMTETMFNALMEFLEVYADEVKDWYKYQFDKDGVLTLTIFKDGEILENWDYLSE